MIDQTDERILKELLRDSQQSHRNIARRIGVSLGTVISRKRRMEQNGTIKGYMAQLDYEKLGYDLTAITEVTVSGGKVTDVGEEIKKLPRAYSVYNVTGATDIMVMGRFKDKADLSNFTKKILQTPNVERTNTHIVLITFREDFDILKDKQGTRLTLRSDKPAGLAFNPKRDASQEKVRVDRSP